MGVPRWGSAGVPPATRGNRHPSPVWQNGSIPKQAKTVTLTPLTPLSHEGRGAKESRILPSPQSAGGEGDYKNGMLPTELPLFPLAADISGLQRAVAAAKSAARLRGVPA
ncbi:MAG: hypothetical protein MUC60_00065 [Oscillatoria sp. Prado101]|jgi:hypothetical protein|nr:hypothetical protein [Oscillatoria sp. Prado101]